MLQPSFFFRVGLVVVVVWMMIFLVAQRLPVVSRVITVEVRSNPIPPTNVGSSDDTFINTQPNAESIPDLVLKQNPVKSLSPVTSPTTSPVSRPPTRSPVVRKVVSKSVDNQRCSEEQSKKAPSILVTAFSQNHFREAQIFLEQAQESLPPNWEIWVYNLGDWRNSTVAALESYCRVRFVNLSKKQLQTGQFDMCFVFRSFKFEWSWLGFDESKQTFIEILMAMKDLTNSLWKPVIIKRGKYLEKYVHKANQTLL